MNSPAQETSTRKRRRMTYTQALRRARQLSEELPGWVCELMKDPCSDEWLFCLYHRERWEQFVRYDPEPC